MDSRIGVLITYFNEKDLLTQCLESVLAQTHKPDEILIYDNASDAPAENYVPAGCPARIFRGDLNRGPSYARNALLQVSQSDYVHFHDADDFFHPEWCERVTEAIEESKADVIFTEASLHKDGDLQERVVGLNKLMLGKDLLRFIIHDSMGVGVPIGTYRKDKLHAIGGYTESLWYGEDVDFHGRLVQHGVSYSVIDEPLVNLRYRYSSHSHQNRLKCERGKIEALIKLADLLPGQYKVDLAEKIASHAIRLSRMGDTSQARKAFKFSRKLGPATFDGQRKSYRILARNLGPELAERLAAIYRRSLPEVFRNYIANRQW